MQVTVSDCSFNRVNFQQVCLVIRCNAFEVNIDNTASVAALKKAVNAKKPNDMKGIDADRLELYIAKTEGGAWCQANQMT
ncbi:hypothetical protein Plhal304r1_c040g0118701 [Plasmopara halstedii]